MQQKGFQGGGKQRKAGEAEQSNRYIRDIDGLKEGCPVESQQYSLSCEQKAITGSLRTQGNMPEPANCKQHKSGKEGASKDNQWRGQDTQLAQHSGQTEEEYGNIGKRQALE